MAIKNISVRIDDHMLDKLHYVAGYEGRSANSQILILIRDCIEQYEAKHGEIEISPRRSVKKDEKKDEKKDDANN